MHRGSVIFAILVSLGACTTPRQASPGTDIPAMIRIAPDTFLAGSDPSETAAAHYPPEFAAREQPARRVRIARAFAIGRTEVTRGQYARFVRDTGWKADGPCSHLVDGPGNRWEAILARDWRNPGFDQSDSHPVVCVSLADAEAYAAWLSRATGLRFRLPSGSEWEYAARAGTTSARWWGDGDDAAVCASANVSDRRRATAHNRGVVDPAAYFGCDDGHVYTAPVGSFRPNPWGLHDILGNVWEWTRDCLDPDQRGAPGDASARTTGHCVSRIDRGASWTNSPKYLRAAAKHPDLVGARTTVLGFRLVQELP